MSKLRSRNMPEPHKLGNRYSEKLANDQGPEGTMKRKPKVARSAKSDKMLRDLGVEKSLARGDAVVAVEPEYRLLRSRELARLAFHRDEEGRLCVGYAIRRDGQWSIEESEPYSMRAWGYYGRRLKRLGEWAGADDDEESEEEE